MCMSCGNVRVQLVSVAELVVISVVYVCVCVCAFTEVDITGGRWTMVFSQAS